MHGVIKHERLYFEERIPLSTKLKDSFLEYVIFKFSDKIIFLSEQSIAIAKDFTNLMIILQLFYQMELMRFL